MTAELASAFMQRVGEWIREERKALGITQGEVAKAIGVSDSTVSSWECGEAMMSAAAHVWLQNYFKRQRQMRPVRKAVTA